MSETLLFFKGFLPYLIIYTLILISIMATIVFFLSSWLARKDKTEFSYRKKEIEENLKNINNIKELIKEEETLKWINKENENKNNRLKEIIHLNNISPSETKKYFKKGVISLILLSIFSFIGVYIYSVDIKAHQPSVYYSQYNNMENINSDNIDIKIEPHSNYKEVTVIDKIQRMEYYYIIEDNNNSIKNVYYSQTTIVPTLLKNIFAVCYIFIVIFLRYMFKIMF